MNRRFAFVRKSIAVQLAAGLALASVEPAWAAVEAQPGAELAPAAALPSLAAKATTLPAHLDALINQPWEVSLPPLLAAARSTSAQADDARLALAMVADPRLIDRMKAALPENAPLQVPLAHLGHDVRRMAETVGNRPELRRLLGEVEQAVAPRTESGLVNKTGARLNAYFEGSANDGAEVEAGIVLPVAAPAARERWGRAVSDIKSAARSRRGLETPKEAVAFASVHMRRDPYAPEVQATLTGDSGFHDAVRALGASDPRGVEPLARRVTALVPTAAADNLHWMRQAQGLERLAFVAAAFSFGAGAAIQEPLLALTGGGLGLSMAYLFSGMAHKERQRLARNAAPYLSVASRLESFEADRTAALERYGELVARQLKLREKARGMAAAFLGYRASAEYEVLDGDTFATGIAKLVRHSDPAVASEARSILEQHASADLFEALSPRGSDENGLAMSRLGLHLLILFPETREPGARLLGIEAWLRKKLDETDFPDRERLVMELMAHVRAVRGLEEGAALPASAETSPAAPAVDAAGAARSLGPAKAIIEAAAELSEAGYGFLVVAAIDFVRVFIADAPETGAAEALLLDADLGRSLRDAEGVKGIVAAGASACHALMEHYRRSSFLDLMDHDSRRSRFTAIALAVLLGLPTTAVLVLAGLKAFMVMAGIFFPVAFALWATDRDEMRARRPSKEAILAPYHQERQARIEQLAGEVMP